MLTINLFIGLPGVWELILLVIDCIGFSDGELSTSEAALCKQHLPFIKKGDVVLFDHYYASYELMFQLLANGSHFVFRMKDNWWKCVDIFIKSGLDEQIVYFHLPAKLKHLSAKYPHLSSTI